MKKLDAALPPIWSRANPVDIAGDADDARYAVALEQLLDDKANDAVLVMNVPTALASASDAAKAVIAVTEQHRKKHAPAKPVFAMWIGENGPAAEVRRRRHSQLRDGDGGDLRLHASGALPRTARLADGDAADLAAGFCAGCRGSAAGHRSACCAIIEPGSIRWR